MVSRTRSTKSVQVPVFKYLPGQEAYLPEYTQVWKDIFAGDVSSPAARALQTMVGEAGMREAATARRSIAETRGLSTPAKQRAVAGIGETAVSTMARVPQEMWAKAAEYLSAYTLTPPTVGTAGRQTGGGGWGICSCDNLKGLNEGKLDENLRRFRDSHFAPLSDIDIGYKAMAEWFVPLIKRNKWMMKLGRLLLLKPLCRMSDWLYADDKLGFVFIPITYFWIWLWKFYGRLSSQRFMEKTPRPLLAFYPLMTSTFISRLKEVR